MPLSLGELETKWRKRADDLRAGLNTLFAQAEANQIDACAQELADVLRAQSERKFPIQNGPDIPWSVIEPFEKQCRRQHSGQTLEGLARRGGLSVCEVLSILEGGGDFDAYWTAAGRDTKDITANILKLQAIVAGRSAVPETPRGQMNRNAYERLVAEDLDWLLHQPRTLERDHIAQLLHTSADMLYPAVSETPAPDLRLLLKRWREVAGTNPKEGANGFGKAVAICADELEAVLVAASPGVRPTSPEWQPIDTAPKDGTRVLLHGPDGITTGYYDPGVKGHEDAFPEGWRGHFNPTHWMPLPDPPVAADHPAPETERP